MYIETFNRVILHGKSFVQIRLVSEKRYGSLQYKFS